MDDREKQRDEKVYPTRDSGGKYIFCFPQNKEENTTLI